MIIGSALFNEIFAFSQFAKDEVAPGFKSFPAIKRTSYQYEPSRPAIQVHMTLEGEIQFERDTLAGTCFLVLKGVAQETSSIELDAKELCITDVTASKLPRFGDSEKDSLPLCSFEKTEWELSNDKLNIKLMDSVKTGQHICLRIQYVTEKPKAGIYFVHKGRQSDAAYDCVWTQGQDVDSPYWFPCQDDPRLKMSTILKFSFPAHWNAMSNGSLVKEETAGKNKTQTWKLNTPHAPYLVAFVAGEMEYHTDSWRNKPVTLLLSKVFAEEKDPILNETKRMLEFYSNYWGYEFPWEKYGQAFVADFLYGGMENTTITINADTTLGPKEFSSASESRTYLVMHEMAHQWFGDTVTCETWAEGWLNEGFATHSELLWDEHVNGKVSGIFYSLESDKAHYLAEAKAYWRPMVTNNYEFVSEIFDGHLYSKGSMILNHLRDVIGEDSFRKAVGHYLRKFQFGPVRTADFMQAIEDATGWNPRKFFDTYIFRGGHIELEVTVKKGSFEKQVLEIELEQTQKISNEFPAFEFETFVFVQYEDGTNEEVRIQSRNAKETIFVPVKAAVAYAIVDPRGTLVGESKQKFSEDVAKKILSASTKDGANAYFKFLAARSLLTHNSSKENATLIANWLKNEECWRARQSAYGMIAQCNSFEVAGLLASVSENHGVARVGWITALGQAANAESGDIYSLLTSLVNGAEESVLARAAALSALRELAKKMPRLRTEPERSKLLNLARAKIKETSFRGLVNAAALGIVAELGNESDIPTLTAPLEVMQQSWRVHVAALRAIATMSAKYPLLRAELRPQLLRFAANLFPVRVAAELPTAWAETRDPIYSEAYQNFINRKNYGLLSMLIPRARRSFDRYLKGLEPSSVAEKFAELSELKQKLAKMEQEFAALKKMMAPPEKT